MKNFLLLLLLLISPNLIAEGKHWKGIKGESNWFYAQDLCQSLGKRLPSRSEFAGFFKIKESKDWKHYDWYWTSDVISAEKAYYFDFAFGHSVGIGKRTPGIRILCVDRK